MNERGVRSGLWMIVSLACLVCISAWGVSCSEQDSGGLRGQVSIDGSSTVSPISTAVAEAFRNEHPRVHVTIGVSGTGGGFKRFTEGEIDICNASRPITKDELGIAVAHGVEFVELPIAYDGVTFIVNKANGWAKNLTIDELKKIFLDSSTVKSWRDIRPDWPDIPIKLFTPGVDSGTFDYFKEHVAGEHGAIRADLSTSENDNQIVQAVMNNKGALGFMGCAYYFANREELNVVGIDGGEGVVVPTVETIEQNIYPLSRPLFIYVNRKSLERPEVEAFATFYVDRVGSLVEGVGYAKLPDDLYGSCRRRLQERATGTVFLDAHGQKISASLTQLYQNH